MIIDTAGKQKRYNRRAREVLDDDSNAPKLVKPMSFSEATEGSTDRGKAGYGRMTSSERSDWKVKHGVAPTAADPSALGKATRAAAKAARAKGELSEQDQRDQKIIKVREIEEAKYDAAVATNVAADNRNKVKQSMAKNKMSSPGAASTGVSTRIAPRATYSSTSVKKATTAFQKKSNRTRGVLDTGPSSVYGSL